MSDDNVIHAFKPADLPEQTLLIEKPPAGKPYFCNHEQLRIDAHERTIHCARCDQAFDPFNFLLHQAQTLQRAWQDYASVKRDLSDMQDRVTALKKEEKSLRGKVDRLKDKVGVVDVRGKSVL
jgi:hypothetical protein